MIHWYSPLNGLLYAIMAGLMFVVNGLMAEKLIVAGYIILLPLSVRYAIRAIQPRMGAIAVLAFPFTYGFLLHMGFYNFCYSTIIFFFTVGYWIKYQDRLTLGRSIAFVFLVSLLFITHLFSYVLAFLALAVITAGFTGIDVRQRDLPGGSGGVQAGKVVKRRLLLFVIAFVPTLLALVVFFLKEGVLFHRAKRLDLGLLWEGMINIYSRVSFGRFEEWSSFFLFLLFIALTIFVGAWKLKQRQWTRWDLLFLVVIVYLSIYFLSPWGVARQGFINERMNPYIFLMLLLWFGAHNFPQIILKSLKFAVLGLAVGMLFFRIPKFVEINDYLKEYSSVAQQIEPRSSMLAIRMSSWKRDLKSRSFSIRPDPFWHAIGYIAAEKKGIDLDNFIATTKYFPIRYRSEKDPAKHIGNYGMRGFRSIPPRVNFIDYAKHSGEEVDYIILWGAKEKHRKMSRMRPIYEQLGQDYEAVYQSLPRGMAQLYRRKGFESSDHGEH